MLSVLTLETPELGDRSYLVHDGRDALVVDPQRDIDRILALARSAQVEIACVAETHIHNDYVSGGLALTREVGATYLVAGQEEVRFERRPVRDGERVRVGSMTVEAVATPGHTPGHIAYLLGSGDQQEALFSGGSLLYGAVGRTDLVSPERTTELAHAQHRSARRLAALPEATALYPTHGFGSFCSVGGTSPSNGVQQIGDQRLVNPAVRDEEEAFVRALLEGYSAYPSYYSQMAPINLKGAAPIDLSPPPELGISDLAERIQAAEWVIDLRPRGEFGPDHLRGTVNFPNGPSLATYVGWVVPWGRPLTLVSEDEGQVARARRDLGRIGVDWLSGWCPVPIGELERQLGGSSFPVTDFAGLARAVRSGEVQILDARRPDEWRQGHIKGALNIHLPDLLERLGELPQLPTWVHCAAGYRAAIAASLLDRAGRQVVLVDDDIIHMGSAGLEVVIGG